MIVLVFILVIIIVLKVILILTFFIFTAYLDVNDEFTDVYNKIFSNSQLKKKELKSLLDFTMSKKNLIGFYFGSSIEDNDFYLSKFGLLSKYQGNGFSGELFEDLTSKINYFTLRINKSNYKMKNLVAKISNINNIEYLFEDKINKDLDWYGVNLK